jgi:hypothetical protein
MHVAAQAVAPIGPRKRPDQGCKRHERDDHSDQCQHLRYHPVVHAAITSDITS